MFEQSCYDSQVYRGFAMNGRCYMVRNEKCIFCPFGTILYQNENKETENDKKMDELVAKTLEI